MIIIQINTGPQNAVTAVISTLQKDQNNTMEWEYVPVAIAVLDLAIDLKNKIKEGEKKLILPEDYEDMQDREG